ncbi:MAG: response regulator [Bacteroidia bacterium]
MKKRILIADDDSISALLTRHILLKEGYEVTTVADGQEILAMLPELPFDLLLLDVEMEYVGGIEVTREIRKHTKFQKLPIIALTAHIFPEMLDQLLNIGMDEYIIKPLTKENFSQIIKKIGLSSL